MFFYKQRVFCSICVVSKFKEIRNSIDFSWIFVLLILIVSTRIIWVRFVSLTTFLLEARWKFVNVKSLLENITISLRLNFDKTSCETTLNKIIICQLYFFIYVIIIYQFKCVDEIMKKIMKYCIKTSTKVTTKKSLKTKTTMRTTLKTTTKKHESHFDDFDDVDSKNEILFWKFFWESFWNARNFSFFTLLNEKWTSKKNEQNITTNLIDVCLTK